MNNLSRLREKKSLKYTCETCTHYDNIARYFLRREAFLGDCSSRASGIYYLLIMDAHNGRSTRFAETDIKMRNIRKFR